LRNRLKPRASVRATGYRLEAALNEATMPKARPFGHVTEQSLSLADAAAHLGWSRRTLIRALVRHGIPMIGSGGGPRLEMADLELLKAKERGISGISSEDGHHSVAPQR
jgi:hypothetical protein